jgi:hypothetical protein
MTPEQVLAGLQERRCAIGDLTAEATGGVYALFLSLPGALPLFRLPELEPLYLGLSADLAQREFDTHFNSKQTGFSTVRRSLGAILKAQLGLTARPRGRSTSEQNLRCYRFQPEGEERLTQWMIENLEVSVQPEPDYKTVEKDLIRFACPVLNLTGWDNPYRAEIKALRKRCADEARLAPGTNG